MASITPFYNYQSPYGLAPYNLEHSVSDPNNPFRHEVLVEKHRIIDAPVYDYQVHYSPLRGIPDGYWNADHPTVRTLKDIYDTGTRPIMQVRSDAKNVMEFILYPDDLRTLVARSNAIIDVHMNNVSRTYPLVDDLLRQPVTPITIAAHNRTTASDAIRTEYVGRMMKSLAQAKRDNEDLQRPAALAQAGVHPRQTFISAALRDLKRPTLECFINKPTNAAVNRVEFPVDSQGGVNSGVGKLVRANDSSRSAMLVSSRLLHTMARMPSGKLSVEMAPLHALVGVVPQRDVEAGSRFGLINETEDLGLDMPSVMRDPCWRVLITIGSRVYILPVSSAYSVSYQLIIKYEAVYSQDDVDRAAEEGLEPWQIPHMLPESYTTDAVDLAKQGIIERAHWCEALGVSKSDPLGGATPLAMDNRSRSTTVPALHAVWNKRMWHFNRTGQKPTGTSFSFWAVKLPFTGDTIDPNDAGQRVKNVLDIYLPMPPHLFNTPPPKPGRATIAQLYNSIDMLYDQFSGECMTYYTSPKYKHMLSTKEDRIKALDSGFSDWGRAYDMFVVLLMRQQRMLNYYFKGALYGYIRHEQNANMNDAIIKDVKAALHNTIAMLYPFVYLEHGKFMPRDVVDMRPFVKEESRHDAKVKAFNDNADNALLFMVQRAAE